MHVRRLRLTVFLAFTLLLTARDEAFAQACESACQDLVQCSETFEGLELHCTDFWACFGWSDGSCVTADQCNSGGCATACDPGTDLACACQVWGGEYCDCYFWPESCGGGSSGAGGDGGSGGGVGGGGSNDEDDGGGGGLADDPNGPAEYAFSNCFGKDYDLNGIADCESAVILSTHPNGIAHSYCQRFGAVCPDVRPGAHKGLDFSAELHNTVYSMTIGFVTQIGSSESNGNFIRIRDPEGREATYIHLSETSFRQVGDRVYPGTAVGYAGETGAAQGVHLHLQVKNPDGQVIDPLTLMAEAC